MPKVPVPANAEGLSIAMPALLRPMGVEPSDWRRVVARRVEELSSQMLALISLLDAMEGDADFEPSLGWAEAGPSALMPILQDDRELDLDLEEGNDDPDAEDDDPGGGNVTDEPHDPGDDDEPFLGWSEHQSCHGAVLSGIEYPVENGRLQFEGEGYHEANRELRSRGLPTVRTSPSL